MLRAGMPEATINEDCYLPPREDDVGPDPSAVGKVDPEILAEAVAQAV